MILNHGIVAHSDDGTEIPQQAHGRGVAARQTQSIRHRRKTLFETQTESSIVSARGNERLIKMWFTLIGAAAVCLAILYLPGYLMARAFPFGRFAAVVLAPAFSVLAITLLGVAAYELVNPCPALGLAAALLAVGLIVYLIPKAWRSWKASATPELLSIPQDARIWRVAAVYIAAALAIALTVFLSAIDGPESFSRNDDTTVHLSIVRGFLDTGTFSTLHTSSFLDQGEVGGFYPAAWHVLVAVVASFFGDAVALSTNAVLVVFVVVTFPLAMCLLMWQLFGSNRTFLLSGALFSTAFGGFPWGFVVWGQLLPNMISFMMVPLALSAFIEALNIHRFQDKAKLLLASAICLCAVAIAQPNGAFTFGILAVLYVISRVFYEPGAQHAIINRKRVLVAVAIFAAACVLWGIMYLAPFMQSVVTYVRAASLTPFQAVVSGLLSMFSVRQGVQPFVSIMIVVGVVYTCRHRRHLWLTIAYAAVLAFYMICTTTEGPVKQILTGFWYTDYNRVGAMAALFAIPLAAVGFACCAEWLKRVLGNALGHRQASAERTSNYMAASVCILIVLFVVGQFLPVSVSYSGRQMHLGLVSIRTEVSSRYSWEETLTSEEDAFVKQVISTIPDHALVINVPADGSCWSYGVEGINTYYRRSSNSGSRSDAEEAKLIRTQLCNAAANEEVQKTLEGLDAHYVMLLDDPSSDNPTKTSLRYEEDSWKGIETITENTPGFKLILSEGDMRLYEIGC